MQGRRIDTTNPIRLHLRKLISDVHLHAFFEHGRKGLRVPPI